MKHLLALALFISLHSAVVGQTNSSASSGGMGWKRIAYVEGLNGRGFGQVTLYTEGGDYRPIFLTINWFHDWSTGAGLSVNTDVNNSNYWNAVRLTDDGTNSYIEVYFLTTVTDLDIYSDNFGWRPAAVYSGTLPNGGGNIRASASAARLNIGDQFTVNFNGNVGIGTASPQAKLAVNGNILAKEVKVKTDISVPDYVFEPDYKLPSLTETEAYIKVHKHLPEVPSAADIKQDGLDLAEMNLLLLKKVEELTLHLIEKERNEARMNERLDRQEALIYEMKEILERN